MSDPLTTDHNHPSDLSWKDAIRYVLKLNDRAMNYQDIAAEIGNLGLRTKLGVTPGNSVNVNLRKHLVDEVEQTETGDYQLRPEVAARTNLQDFFYRSKKAGTADEEFEVSETAAAKNQKQIIQSFGMYWSRADVKWTAGSIKLWGQETAGADLVNFADQAGVYILYNGEKPIYVGQASGKRLGRRLDEHTRDRHKTRWDRFSWFGLLAIDPEAVVNGSIPLVPRDGYTSDPGELTQQLLDALEAVLIEGMEPPQNRRQGNNFSALEFMQVRDPRLGQGNS